MQTIFQIVDLQTSAIKTNLTQNAAIDCALVK